MKKVFTGLFLGTMCLAAVGCGKGEYVEPPPIDEIQEEGVPPIGEE